MSMIFLFEDEIIRYKFLDKKIRDKMNNRIAVEKTDKLMCLEYNKKDLKNDAECWRMTIEEYLKVYIDSIDLRYVSQELQLLELDTNIRIKANMYKVQQDYIDMIDELDILKQRHSKVYNLLSKKYNVINLYLSNGCLYLGKRLKNEDDMRILGELADGNIVMNQNDYINLLQSIKDEIQTS